MYKPKQTMNLWNKNRLKSIQLFQNCGGSAKKSCFGHINFNIAFPTMGFGFKKFIYLGR